MGPVEAIRQREAHVWAREENDWYVEPRWCSERLFEESRFTKGMTVLDPACGMGTIVEAACASGLHGLGSDLVMRWQGREGLSGVYRQSDFLDGAWPAQDTPGWRFPDAIVSNPPFKHAERFAELALKRAVSKVCLLLPTKWAQGDKRSRWLASTPLYCIWLMTPRPSMPPGHLIQAGVKPGGGKEDFAWFEFLRGFDGEPSIRWLRRDP